MRRTAPIVARRLLRGAAVALALACQPAAAAIDCWIDAEHPTTADSLPVGDARVATLRSTMQQLKAVLHRQPALHELPRTRLRSSWQIGGQWEAPARSAGFLLRDHRESVWGKSCSVKAGADRLEPRMGVVVRVNAPEAFFHSNVPELRDEQLSAYREVPATGTVRGHTLYGGYMLVFTADGRVPWVPVTTAEYLDFTVRDLTRQRDEAKRSGDAARQASAPSEQDTMLERVAEGLRKTDPANAEKLIAEIRAQHAQAQAANAAAEARRKARGADDAPYETMLRKVHAYRASLTPQQLAGQARLGMNGLQPADVPAERFAPLARPDPAFPWDRSRPAQAQMMMVSVRGGQEFEQPMQRVLQTLDVDALQRLVRSR